MIYGNSGLWLTYRPTLTSSHTLCLFCAQIPSTSRIPWTMSSAVSRRRRNGQQPSKPWGSFLWQWGLSSRSTYLVCWTSSEQPCPLRTLPISKHLCFDFPCHPSCERKGAPSISMELKSVLCLLNLHVIAKSYKKQPSSVERQPFPSEMALIFLGWLNTMWGC